MVNDQEITLTIHVVEGRKHVGYEFQSTKAIEPMAVALTMLRIAQDICVDNQTDVYELLYAQEKEPDSQLH